MLFQRIPSKEGSLSCICLMVALPALRLCFQIALGCPMTRPLLGDAGALWAVAEVLDEEPAVYVEPPFLASAPPPSQNVRLFLCCFSCSPPCPGFRSPTQVPLLLWSGGAPWEYGAPHRRFAFQERRQPEVVLSPEA